MSAKTIRSTRPRQDTSQRLRQGRPLLACGSALLLMLATACGPQEDEQRELIAFHENKQLKVTGREIFHDGEWVKHGEASFYHEDGVTHRAVGNYAYGLEQGWWNEWYEDGTRAEGQYLDGHREGLWIYWYEQPFEGNPIKQEEGHYLAGKRSGNWSWWYSDGRKRSLAAYEGGKMNGPRTDWHVDGTVNLVESGMYEAGRRAGD